MHEQTPVFPVTDGGITCVSSGVNGDGLVPVFVLGIGESLLAELVGLGLFVSDVFALLYPRFCAI